MQQGNQAKHCLEKGFLDPNPTFESDLCLRDFSVFVKLAIVFLNEGIKTGLKQFY